MTLLRDAVVTVLCAAGLFLCLWQLLGRLLRPGTGSSVRALIPGRGDGGELEQAVRDLVWLRSLGLLRCPIVIADVDLTAEGWEIALRLTARWPGVVLWPLAQLEEYMLQC